MKSIFAFGFHGRHGFIWVVLVFAVLAILLTVVDLAKGDGEDDKKP
jgi:hypothetical protein